MSPRNGPVTGDAKRKCLEVIRGVKLTYLLFCRPRWINCKMNVLQSSLYEAHRVRALRVGVYTLLHNDTSHISEECS